MRRPIMIFAALASFIVYPTLARADMCFRYQKTGGGTLVVKGGKLPAVNTCEPLAMFESGGLAGAATGSICRDINDFTVIFQYTYDACIGPGHYFESATCRLQIQNGNLPTVSSTCRGTLAGGSGFFEIDDAVLEYCDGAKFPVLGGGGGQCFAGGFRHNKIDPATPSSK